MGAPMALAHFAATGMYAKGRCEKYMTSGNVHTNCNMEVLTIAVFESYHRSNCLSAKRYQVDNSIKPSLNTLAYKSPMTKSILCNTTYFECDKLQDIFLLI